MNYRVIGFLASLAASAAASQTVQPVAGLPASAKALPLTIGGRVTTESGVDGSHYRRQWPGTYFETGFVGSDVYFKVGPGDVSLRVTADGGAPLPLVKPAPGIYHVAQLPAGRHLLRVDVVSESQSAPTEFDGFYAAPNIRAASMKAPSRQIEFIGDSHTVGYGNMSTKRDCTSDEVWAATDTSRGLAAVTARHYGATYQVNAISGRGVVRNYNGFAADTLPQAYPYILFDKAARYGAKNWHPQLIVIALGTNDFSTPLNSGEKWTTRDALHEDYEATYVRFVRDLRARNRDAFFLLWATDMAGGEIEAEVRNVTARLQQAGETRVGFVPVRGLAFSACHFHPSAADDRTIAAAIESFVDAHPEVWRRM